MEQSVRVDNNVENEYGRELVTYQEQDVELRNTTYHEPLQVVACESGRFPPETE